MKHTEWDSRYLSNSVPWDLGSTTPGLIDWVKQHPVKGKRVLVPGCGIGHDAHYLAKMGALVTAVDYSPEAIKAAREAYPSSRVTWVEADVTQMSFSSEYDLIWEYTCFCALLPELRDAYLDRVRLALGPGGHYLGFVFAIRPSPGDGPPFAIEPAVFEVLLSQRFQMACFEPFTDRSLKARRGKEIWFQVTHRP